MTITSTTAPMTGDKQAPGSIHPAFEWKKSQHIDLLNVTVEEYQHKITGALHYHLAADNVENVFLVALRTVPTDSRGAAHILEHTALCGSKRFPVRDPFFMMIRRSLNTFMNAFTSSDWTAYPFASQNKKDFFNLLDVYLDAVFFTNLDELDFLQEGHRFEFEKADDPSGALVYKGVVFNEMKGAMASPVSTVWQTFTKYLFPTTTYHFNSGGDPESIPDLDYQQLKEFYKTYYHPSNAVFMTYGDYPVYELQEQFELRVLSKFERINSQITVPDEKRYLAPVVVEEFYSLDEGDATGDKTHIIIGWLLDKSIDLEKQLAAHLMSGVLLDNSASPLLKALETTDLGSSPSVLCGLEDSNREMAFVCGLEGSKPENAVAVEKLIFDVLKDVAENGIPLAQVESVLHQLELDQREVGGGAYPYGLQLILDGLSSAIHRGDPAEALNIDPVLNKLRDQIQNPDFIKNLIKDSLLDNQHWIRLTMKPDVGMSERRNQAEKNHLERIKINLSDSEKQHIVDLAARLEERQNQVEDENILPKVGLEDIPESMYIAKGTKNTDNNINSSFYIQGTNGLAYQQFVAKMPKLDDDLLEILPYYTSSLTELGCGDKDYLEAQAWQASISGGVRAFTMIQSEIEDVQQVSGHFFLSSKGLSRNHKVVTELLHTIINHARFNEGARIGELVSQQRAHREQGVMSNGHGLAMLAASSGLSPGAALKHRLSGLAGIQHIKQLDKNIKQSEDQLNDLCEKYAALHERLISGPHEFLLIGEQQDQNEMQKHLQHYWENTLITNEKSTESDFEAFSLPKIQQQVKQMWVTSAPVNFCAKAYPTVGLNHDDAPALFVLGGFLRNGYLHRAVREQGGAYGGGAAYQSGNAVFRFFSYRDPRLSDTLTDFDKSIEWLLENKHESRQLEEAILGVIGAMDKPASPAGEAKDAFQNELYGRTPEQRQQFRSSILKVTIDDLQKVGNHYFDPDSASVAVITNAATLDELGDLGFEVVQL